MIHQYILKKQPRALLIKASQTDDFNNTQEIELKRLKHSIKELRESYDKNMRSHFADHVISLNELCNYYTGFSSVDVLNAVFEYLDSGIK